jgi:hypothetical protein
MIAIPLPQVITAIGGLGTAAFGLVDAMKPVIPAINRIGFDGINKTVSTLTPGARPQQKILETVEANWINGTDLGSQKSIAKSLIKLNINPGNATNLAAATAVDPAILASVATKMASGTALSSAESDVFQRFDFTVTALLDEAYQRSDQHYRNKTRFLAMLASIGLALAGGFTLAGGQMGKGTFAQSLLMGLLATPLAPVAKDLSTALATAVNTLQLVKK